MLDELVIVWMVFFFDLLFVCSDKFDIVYKFVI